MDYCTLYTTAGRQAHIVVTDIATGAEGLGFDTPASQIEHSVANWSRLV